MRLINFILITLLIIHSSYGTTPVTDVLQEVYSEVLVDEYGSKVSMRKLAEIALSRIHPRFPAVILTTCYINECLYKDALDILKTFISEEEVSKYWSILMCAKHGASCAEPYVWSSWQNWSKCSVKCGSIGRKIRFRSCDKKSLWGKDCIGNFAESDTCTGYDPYDCLIQTDNNHFWSKWSVWQACTKTCGLGYTSRFRYCMPYNASKACTGSAEETSPCLTLPPCPVSGIWSFYEYLPITDFKPCGKVYQPFTRNCTSRTGLGKICVGRSNVMSFKMIRKCPSSIKYKKVIFLNEKSWIQYQPQVIFQYLAFFIRFRPTSRDGSIAEYSFETSVINTNGDSEIIKADMIHIDIYEENLVIQTAFQGTLPTKDLIAGIMIDEWNTIELVVTSPIMSVRLNDAENWLKREIKFKQGSENFMFGINTPSLLTFKGKIRIGKTSDKLNGFQGYISLLRINYNDMNLTTPKEDKTFLAPLSENDIEILDEYHNRNIEARSLIFFGHNRLSVPRKAVWWEYSDKQNKTVQYLKYNSRTHYCLFIKPLVTDSIVLWSIASDGVLQKGLIVEAGKRVKYVLHDEKKTIFTVSTSDALQMNAWNKIEFFFMSNGDFELILNNQSSVSRLLHQTQISPTWVLGGYDQKVNNYFKRFKGFRGYISSFTENGLELVTGVSRLSSFEFKSLSSEFISKPAFTAHWYFLSTLHPLTTPGNQYYYGSIDCNFPVSFEGDSGIKWFKNGLPVSNSDFYEVIFAQNNLSSTLYILKSNSRDDDKNVTGVYTCVLDRTDEKIALINHAVIILALTSSGFLGDMATTFNTSQIGAAMLLIFFIVLFNILAYLFYKLFGRLKKHKKPDKSLSTEQQNANTSATGKKETVKNVKS